MSEFIRLQANGVDAYPDASTENTYRSNGTSVESALLALESNVNTLGGVAGEAKTLAEQNSVKIATAEQEISDINSSLENIIGLKLVGYVSANGTSWTYYIDEILNKNSTYLVIIRPTNSSTDLMVLPIIERFFNPNYITVSSDNRLGAILSQAWGFAYFYKFSSVV